MTTSFGNIVPGYTRVSSGFVPTRVDPVTGNYVRPHKGADIAAPNGSPIYSPADGVVVKIGWDPDGFGNYVVIQHTLSDGTVVDTLYAHLAAPSGLSYRQPVAAGAQIGEVGSTGHSTGAHLHYEERKVVGVPDADGIYRWDKAIPQDPEANKFHLSEGTPDFSRICTPTDTDGNGIPDYIDALKKKFAQSKKIISPIVLDLNGDGITTTAVGSGTYFDHDANGFAEATGWVNSEDGILVRDLDGNGTIDSGRELFGSETLLANGRKAANGYAALSELDTNQDGQIDAQDAAFASLKIWKDANGDGYSSADELFTLTGAGVQSIATGSTVANQIDANGNTAQQTGAFTRSDGSIGSSADIWFSVNNTGTIATEWLPETAAVAALPDLQGFGNVYDLHQAMLRDSTGHLQDLIRQFARIQRDQVRIKF